MQEGMVVTVEPGIYFIEAVSTVIYLDCVCMCRLVVVWTCEYVLFIEKRKQ